tara:strand:+ start:396 stop:722 length:327 start_codon:yes stop_codon:yes gene_type:complete
MSSLVLLLVEKRALQNEDFFTLDDDDDDDDEEDPIGFSCWCRERVIFPLLLSSSKSSSSKLPTNVLEEETERITLFEAAAAKVDDALCFVDLVRSIFVCVFAVVREKK